MKRTIPVLDVERALPSLSKLALEHFVNRNPHWRGAEWADALDQLDNSDANLEVTEPIWEQLNRQGFITDENRKYVTLCILTALWACGPPVAADVKSLVRHVMKEAKS